jgi:serine/threonine protein kinase
LRERSSGKEVALEELYLHIATARHSAVRRTALPLVVNLPWVIQPLAFFIGPSRIYEQHESFCLVTEFFPNGTLEDVLRKLHKGKPRAGFGPTERAKCIFGVAFAMAAFHSRRGIHGRFSSRAVLLDSRFEPRIGYLGFAKFVGDSLTLVGPESSLLYVAPELFEHGAPVSQAADVFSFAILVYEIFEAPTRMAGSDREMRTQHAMARYICRGDRWVRPSAMPDQLWALVTACWAQDPAARPPFAAIVERLKNSPDSIVPGTDVAAYREYQTRFEGVYLPEPGSPQLIEVLYGLLGWDPMDPDLSGLGGIEQT